mgnify:CR=1 FL=1
MEGSGFVTLTRQVGLMREMQVVANNIANSATAGVYAACMKLREVIATRLELDPDLVVPDPRKSLAKGALAPWAGVYGIGFVAALAARIAAQGGAALLVAAPILLLLAALLFRSLAQEVQPPAFGLKCIGIPMS